MIQVHYPNKHKVQYSQKNLNVKAQTQISPPDNQFIISEAPSKRSNISQLTHQKDVQKFDSNELRLLLKSFCVNNLMSEFQFNGLFLAFGLQNVKLYQPHIHELIKFNTRFVEIHSLRKQPISLKVKHDDVAVVQWLWSFSTFVCQSEKNIPIEFMQDILTQMVDLSIADTKALSSVEQIAKYYLEICKSSQNNIFISTVDLHRKNMRSQLIPFFEQLPQVMTYFRDRIFNYNHCSVMVANKNLHQDNNIVESIIDIGEDISIFDKLFRHSKLLQDKQKMYQYQKEINEIKNSSFSPHKTSQKFTNQSPKIVPRQLSSKNIMISIDKLIGRSQTPTPQTKMHSPSQEQVTLSDVKGADSMIQRLQKGRVKQDRLKNFWDAQDAKQAKVAAKVVQPFDLTVHQFPHAKPQMFVDVEIATGKHQRIGLYGCDDMDKIASNFGKAHQLKKKQVIGLKVRLQDIANQYIN